MSGAGSKALIEVAKVAVQAHPVAAVVIGVVAVAGFVYMECKKNDQSESRRNDEDMSLGNRRGVARQN